MLGGFLLALFPTQAIAQEPSEPTGQYYYTEYEQRWYGWQTLAVDVPSLAVFAIAQIQDKQAVSLGALGIFVAGSPVVHAMHRRPVPAMVSGFAHLLLPLGGYALERPIMPRIMPNSRTRARVSVAMTVGALAASALDVFVFAYEYRESQVEIQRNARWIPQVAFTATSAWVGWQVW